MILYHTSTLRIEKPDLSRTRPYLDFGLGFYLTSIEEQAFKYGDRFLRRGEPAVMNTYELDDNLTGFSRKVFEAYDAEWLDFVSACRKGLDHEVYDLIEGGIANDKVFNTVDLYLAGIYTREQAYDQLRFKAPNYQICITSQKLVDEHLHFLKSRTL